MIINIYKDSTRYKEFESTINSNEKQIELKGTAGSALSVYISTYFKLNKGCLMVIMPNKESAAYFYNDMENLLCEVNSDVEKKQVLFFPNSYKS